jgi:hypothetical protein
MSIRRLTTIAAFLLMVLSLYSGSTLPQQRNAEAPERVAPLRFGQSIVLSDFDSDGLVDEATIDGSSLHKSVGIRLSGSGKRSFLHFNANRENYGSLFAQDVDNDGATDLVWTDLLHADDVIVWLGDGTGRFERCSTKAYRDRFILGHTSVYSPEWSDHEAVISSETNRQLDPSPVHKCGLRVAIELPNLHVDGVATLSPALGQPAGRSPPSLLS